MAKVKKDRKKELLLSWNQTRKVADAVIKAGIKNPASLRQGVLRELVSLLSHGMKVVRLMATLEAQGEKGMYVQRRRRELVKMWDGISTISKHLTEQAMENPLEIKSSELNQLGLVARRSLEMITVLEAMEAQQEEELLREKNKGMTLDEEALLKEFESMDLPADISPDDFKTNTFNDVESSSLEEAADGER